MPKSKKNKVVHLTQVKKKGKDHKEDLMKQLEAYIKQYNYVYVFDFDATKSDRIMNLRLKMKQHGAIFAGRNSLVSLTLKSIGSKTRTSYNKFLKHIAGHRGLLFTNLTSDKLVAMLEAGQQEFREKLLGYAPLKATSTNEPAEVASSDDDSGEADEDDDDEEEEGEDKSDTKGGKKKKKKKPMKIIRFRRIAKAKRPKKPTRQARQEEADGDVVLADADEEGQGEEEAE